MLENNPETRLAEVEWVGKLEYLCLYSHSNLQHRQPKSQIQSLLLLLGLKTLHG